VRAPTPGLDGSRSPLSLFIRERVVVKSLLHFSRASIGSIFLETTFAKYSLMMSVKALPKVGRSRGPRGPWPFSWPREPGSSLRRDCHNGDYRCLVSFDDQFSVVSLVASHVVKEEHRCSFLPVVDETVDHVTVDVIIGRVILVWLGCIPFGRRSHSQSFWILGAFLDP